MGGPAWLSVAQANALWPSWPASPRSLGFWEHMAIAPEILAKKAEVVWPGHPRSLDIWDVLMFCALVSARDSCV